MEYSYLGYAGDRRIVRGTIAASSEEVARHLLSRNNYRVLELKPVGGFVPAWDALFPSLFSVKPAEIVMFSRQLALLLESGTDIVTALDLLQAQASNRSFRRVLGEVISDLRDGNRLSAALARHPKIFPKVYVQSLVVGERSGGLETVLRQVADYMEKEARAAKGVKGALSYPAIVAVIAFIVIAVMVVFVFPAFASLYGELGADLPVVTRMVLSAVGWLTAYGLFAIGAVAVVAFLGYLYARTPTGRLQRDGLMFRLPVLGRITHFSELARCCRSMSLLFRAGLPLPQIMTLVIESAGNSVMKRSLEAVRQSMLKGEGLSQPMSRDRIFLPMMVQMVGVGQATGNLDVTLLAVAECYETEAEDKVHSMIGMIQPAITLLVGGVVGLIALSLISAMYSIYGQLS